MHSLPRSFLVFAFCLPLAVVLGFVLATPLDRTTMALLGGSLLLLLSPIFLTSHHTILVVSCLASVNIYFLPGQPQLWLLATAASCFFLVLTRSLNRGKIEFLRVPSLFWPLACLFGVTVITAYLTGGLGVRALGSGQYGGRRYVYLWGAIAAFFAISALPIPREKRHFIGIAYFLSGITSVVSNIAYTLGPNFYFLFFLFPAEYAIGQVVGGTAADDSVRRISGLAPAATALICAMLAKYGLTGLLNIRTIWRPIAVVALVGVGMLSGFRSVLAFTILLLGALFIFEGIYKTKYCLAVIFAALLIGALTVPFADKLPLPVQRCLTLLPLDLDRAAIEDARGSSQWRVEMWRVVSADIPKYFWLGKGYAIDPTDLWFAQEARRGGYEGAIIAGDYHSGPLTLLLPFGIWGALAFGWFAIAGLRALWLNMKNGEPDMKQINTLLFSYFVAKLIFFLFIFGAFYADLLFFSSIVALSISLNRGVLRVPQVAPIEVVPEPVRPSLPLRLPPRGGFQPA